MAMACNLIYDDRPMSAAQLFTYIRHRYGDMKAYYLLDRDIVAIPLTAELEEAVAGLRELAARKGLDCCEVSAAWPELAGAGTDGHRRRAGVPGDLQNQRQIFAAPVTWQSLHDRLCIDVMNGRAIVACHARFLIDACEAGARAIVLSLKVPLALFQNDP